jgi:hypothetical protein
MNFNITQEEIDNEILRIKEEERIKSIVSVLLNKVNESFEVSFKELKKETEALVKSKDEEIEKLKTSLLEFQELSSMKETIKSLQEENLELKSKILSIKNDTLELTRQFSVKTKAEENKLIPQKDSKNLDMNDYHVIRKFLLEERTKYFNEGKIIGVCQNRQDHKDCQCFNRGGTISHTFSNPNMEMVNRLIAELFTGYLSSMRPTHWPGNSMPYIYDIFTNLFDQPVILKKFKTSVDKVNKEFHNRQNYGGSAYIEWNYERYNSLLNALV